MSEPSSELICMPKIVAMQVREFESHWSSEPHVAKVPELLYVVSGKVTQIWRNGLRFQAVAGQMLLTPRGTEHQDVFEMRRGLRTLLVFFEMEPESEKEYCRQVTNLCINRLEFEDRYEVLFNLEKLRESALLRRRSTTDQLRLALILNLFYDRSRSAAEPAVRRLPQTDLVKAVRHYCERNFQNNPSLEDAAANFGLSPQYLSRFFKNRNGIGYAKYLAGCRMTAAVRLLHNTNLTVAEIADRCGYADSSHFIRAFRERYHSTPRRSR